jgi:hypothetical protein
MKRAVVNSGRPHPNGRGVIPATKRAISLVTPVATRHRHRHDPALSQHRGGGAMGQLPLDAIAKAVAPGSHALLIIDQAGLAQSKLLAGARSDYARYAAAVFTRTKPHGKRLGLSAAQ